LSLLQPKIRAHSTHATCSTEFFSLHMSEPFLHVLYASQTGCAQSVAEDFGRLVAQVLAPSIRVIHFNAKNISSLRSGLV
jgi:hypothetical protein